MMNPLRYTTLAHLPHVEPSKALLDAATSAIAPAETPKTAALGHLGLLDRGLTLELDVVTAALQRLQPDPPPPQTLQEKVRAARRRLTHQSLVGKSGILLGTRLNLVRLRAVLEVNV